MDRGLRIAGRTALAGLVLLLVILAWWNAQLTPLLQGESAVLANVPIHFLQSGVWRYPLHAQEVFFPGVDIFMIHPPLHYVAAVGSIAALGVSPFSLHLVSTIEGFVATLLAALLATSAGGARAAALTLALALTSGALFYSMASVRADMAFGTIFISMVLVQWLTVSTADDRRRNAFCFALGLLLVAALATHWFGFFFALYVPLIAFVFVYFFGTAWWRPTLWLAGGGLAGFAVWAVFFGEQLPRALIFALLRGGNFVEISNSSMLSYAEFVTHWPGGLALLIGVALSALWALFAISTFAKGESLSSGQAISILLVANLLVYHFCFFLFVGAKKPSYGAHVLPLLFALSAIGYAETIRLRSRRIQAALLSALMLVIIVPSPVVREISTKFLTGEQSIRRIHDAYRTALLELLPADARVLMGGAGYQFLWDKRYVSTMRLVAEAKMPKQKGSGFLETVAYYRRNPYLGFRETKYTASSRRVDIERTSDAVVLGRTSHAWQDLFRNPEVLPAGFVEQAAIFPRSQPEFRASTVSNGLGASPVMISVATRENDNNTLGGSCSIGDTRLIVWRYSARARSIRLIRPQEWAALDTDARESTIFAYLEECFGGEGAARFASDLLEDVNAVLESGGSFPDSEGSSLSWTFGLAADLYFESKRFDARP